MLVRITEVHVALDHGDWVRLLDGQSVNDRMDYI